MAQTEFTYEAVKQILVIHLPENLDHHNCKRLKLETDILFSENYISRVVFDFGNTEFMDSSGMGVLLNRYKQMKRSGGRVAVYGVRSQVERVFKIGGIYGLVDVFETKEQAMAG